MAEAVQLLDPRDVSADAAVRLLPASGISPSEAAHRYLKTDTGDLDLDLSPMMREPLDELAGRRYRGIVFAGPQRSSKSFALVLGGITYVVTSAPGDALVVHMTKDTGRDWSLMDLSKAIRYSPQLSTRLTGRARDDNTLDKRFRGMTLKIGWPAVSQLSAKTFRYVFITDYDRPENRDDVDGEGPLWDLGLKRIETFMSRGKCVAESSPGEDLLVGDWKPSTPHEAPPVRGILSLYNNGTRARWYWCCTSCNGHFQVTPGYDLFRLPSLDKLVDMVRGGDVEGLVEEFARVACPHCGAVHEQHQKRDLNDGALWLHEGETLKRGKVTGDRIRTRTWSGWLGGAAASVQRWDGMLRNLFDAVQTYARTSDESPLRLAYTSDAALPYTPRLAKGRRKAEDLVKRAEVWPYRSVPRGVRFLTMAADIQANRFVVEVHGWGVGLERWLVDRFDISALQPAGGGELRAVDPSAYAEDWMVLVDAFRRQYQCDGLDFKLPIMRGMVDSGGRSGVTQQALAWQRYLLRNSDQGLQQVAQVLQLIKGAGAESPRIKVSWPDTRKRKDRGKASRGDVPVWRINANIFKDGLAGELARTDPGPGYYHFPKWVEEQAPGFFDELLAEVRTEKGWERPKHKPPNEAMDLANYNRAAVIALGGERIDWDKPPPWALPPEKQAEAGRRVTPMRRGRRVRSSGVSV